jgi:NAD+ synthase
MTVAGGCVACGQGAGYRQAMTAPSLRLALAQLNPTIGDIAGNAANVLRARADAHADGAELLMLPELFLSGAPAQGLLASRAFVDTCRRACEDLARATADGGPAILLGLPWREEGLLYNACALLDGGCIQSLRFKVALARQGVRDETSLFAAGPLPGPIHFREKVRLGVVIGEDLFSEEVAECLAETGAELLLAPCASPYHRGVSDIRMNLAVARSVETDLPLVGLNQIGGQDELAFDGASFVLNGDRTLAHQLPAFRDALVLSQWQRDVGRWRCDRGEIAAVETGDEADYAAIVLGIRDLVAKLGAGGAALSLAGDLLSRLCAAIAVDALGSERVLGIAFQDAGTIEGGPSLQDFAAGLGIRLEHLPEGEAVSALKAALPEKYLGPDAGLRLTAALTQQTQALLATTLAETEGYVLLSTPASSGSLIGAPSNSFRPLKDVDATQARRLAALRGHWKPADALGPDNLLLPDDRNAIDEALDPVVALLAGEGLDVLEIVARGHDPLVVAQAESLLREARRARRDAGPGVLLSVCRLDGLRPMPAVHLFVDKGEPRHEPDPAVMRPGAAGGGANPDV